VRLVNGGAAGPDRGILEVFFRGTWASLYNGGTFNGKAAQVACRQLGWTDGWVLPGGGTLWAGSSEGPTWRVDFECQGSEAWLSACPRNWDYGEHTYSSAGSYYMDVAALHCFNGAWVAGAR
jgi:hypothetical protein